MSAPRYWLPSHESAADIARVLGVLHDTTEDANSALPVADIADYAGIDVARTTAALATLEGDGLIRKVVSK